MDMEDMEDMDEDAEVIEDNSDASRASSTSTDDNEDDIFKPSACSSSTLVDYVQVGNLSPVEPLSHQLGMSSS